MPISILREPRILPEVRCHHPRFTGCPHGKGFPGRCRAYGREFAIEQCADLIRQGIRYFHFYTMNQAETIIDILGSSPWVAIRFFKKGIKEGQLKVKASSNIFEVFYRTFRDISRSVHSSTKVDEVLSLVVKKSTELLQARGALIRILNLESHEMDLFAAHGLSERYLSKGQVSSETIITDLCKLNKVILIRDIEKNPRIQYPGSFRHSGASGFFQGAASVIGQFRHYPKSSRADRGFQPARKRDALFHYSAGPGRRSKPLF